MTTNMIIVEEISPNDKKVHETVRLKGTLKELDKKISVSYSWQNITKANTTLFVYSNKVYDPSNEDNLFGNDSVTEWLRGLLGKDATREILHTRRNSLIKFISAIEFDWFLSWQLGKYRTTSHIILLVTCYSEDEHLKRTTLDSLANNDKTTPEICEDLIEPFNLSSFDLAIGKMAHQKNEKGLKSSKRDSQLILMEWLSNIFFNERMTPLEFELFEKDSVSRMVAVMERDPTVMGLCGERKIANKKRVGVFLYVSYQSTKIMDIPFPYSQNPIVELYYSTTVEMLHQKFIAPWRR
ncbi:1907_t:CDS:2 [Funneliformis mosseae]|uniref:1907_t:CDS:1 n=1 Tax=Funneliformis mosseae TaxID=27381 RepID=A0A9N8UXZ5_FUNMO|nr:1907_t:CDS:2 [Funneliformis mosseae]